MFMTPGFDGIGNREGAPQRARDQGLACRDELGLARAAAALGANACAVLVLEATTMEVVYRCTKAGDVFPPEGPIPCGLAVGLALDSNLGPVPANSAAARFLTSAVLPTANSFLLFPWQARPSGVTIVFGFEAQEPAHSVPAHVRDSLNPAALAAWSLKELSRLRAELRTANHRFAGRKLVERAKGILQSERDMSEQQAYEYLRRMSRQRRITISKLAEDLLGAARWP
jgi:hypothetical protein